jgi:hypothetical protein
VLVVLAITLWPIAIMAVLVVLAHGAIGTTASGRAFPPAGRWTAAFALVLVPLVAMAQLSPRSAGSEAQETPRGPIVVVASTPAITEQPVVTVEPVGRLEIVSPIAGSAVSSSPVIVSGLAPAGSRVVRDVSLGFDESATVASDGRWTMSVDLDEGSTVLVFRLDDDRSTEVQLAVQLVSSPAASVAAPSATPTPTAGTAWPADFELLVCAGVQQIDDSGNHMAEAGEAAEDFDIDRMIEEAEKAATDAGEARDYLDAAPSWKPGQAAVDLLRRTAQKSIEAANLLQLGAATLDSSVIDEAGQRLERAFDLKIQATLALVELERNTGLTCFA